MTPTPAAKGLADIVAKHDKWLNGRKFLLVPYHLPDSQSLSGALQRERTALKLMQQLLVNYRDTLPVGQLMPLGAIFDVLAAGADRPFTDKLKDEFETAKEFYGVRVRPGARTQAPVPRRRPRGQDAAARRCSPTRWRARGCSCSAGGPGG